MPSTVLQRTFLPLESVQLGRFVLNIDEPQSDYIDPACDTSADVITNPQFHYSAVQQSATNKDFTAKLARLASASRSKRNGVSTKVVSDRVTTYQLSNSGQWFKRAIIDEKLRRWIVEAIEQGDNIYMIVGYHTMFDAHVIEGGNSTSDSSARLNVPVTAALAATGAVTQISNIVDPSVGGGNKEEQRSKRQFLAVGEQICAIQYRKLRFKWYSSRDMDKATLEKENRWKIYWDMRGQEPGTHDVLESDLQAELELDDNYEQEVWDKDGDIFF